MQNRKTIFFIGFIVFLLPVLGFPGSWESFFEIVSGLILMFLAARKTLEKRIVKDKRIRLKRKEKNPIYIESNPVTDSPVSATINETSQGEVEEKE